MNFSFTQFLLGLLKPPQDAIPHKNIFPKANYHYIKGIPEKVDRPKLPYRTVLPAPVPWIGTNVNGNDLKKHFINSPVYRDLYNIRKSKSFYNERGPIEQLSHEWRNRPWQNKQITFRSAGGPPKSISSRNPREPFVNNFFSTARGQALPNY